MTKARESFFCGTCGTELLWTNNPIDCYYCGKCRVAVNASYKDAVFNRAGIFAKGILRKMGLRLSEDV